jgi:hypothetical protein
MTESAASNLKYETLESLPTSPASFSGASSSWGTLAHSTSSLLSSKSNGTATETGLDRDLAQLLPFEGLDAKHSIQEDIDWKFTNPSEPVTSMVIGPLEALQNPSLASFLTTSSNVSLSQLVQQVPSPKNQAFTSAFQAALQSAMKETVADNSLPITGLQLQAHTMALVAAHVAAQEAAQVATQRQLSVELTTLGPLEDAIDLSRTNAEIVEPLPTPKFVSRRSLWDLEERSTTPTAFFTDVVEEVQPLMESDEEIQMHRRHTVTIMETAVLEQSLGYASDSSEASNFSAQMTPAQRGRSESHDVDVSWDEKEEEYEEDEPRRRFKNKKRASLPLSPLSRHGGDYQEKSKKPLDLTNRPFKCLYCDSSFVRKHDLKRHERIHLGMDFLW